MKRSTVAVAVVSLVVILTGCAADKFTRTNYDIITPNVDTEYDVRQILGEPSQVAGNEWFYSEEDHEYHATIKFDNAGTVASKEWMDTRTGEWDDDDAEQVGDESEETQWMTPE